MVSAKTVLRLAIKVVGLLLLVGSAFIAYNLATTSFAAFTLMGPLTALFVAFLVIGAVLMLIY
ncbi:MAG: hypothetical protein RMI43_01550 [Candidatus Caldarchaeum sp.]|nr:hypothetical protein [Candidatus Caldarchaeum sp.]MCS7134142.1 hypothetical protein [Candidatus Caldarchaeum sp.]MCX8201003.1 hypothetical protein [Candidatus Caldarchaeum sp.]MDW8062839.1 hypothetical protein [Candidatus Caldarchaeum sp.]MDW8435236.1 hypothetical protein [Candidatus Caldarchaeum sp.]